MRNFQTLWHFVGARHVSPLLIALITLWTAACTPTPTPTPPPSQWGQIITLAHAPQRDAPTLVFYADQVTAAWIGSDDAGVHQDARTLTGTPIVLPLPPRHPYAQHLAPASDDHVHLLWLDADSEHDDETRLFSAVLSPELTVSRGPTLISDQQTLNYSDVPGSEGARLVAWSGGLLSEPAVFLQTIDDTGRPQHPVRAAANADFPALVRTDDGAALLFWIGTTDEQIYRAAIVDGKVESPTAITTNVSLHSGDRLETFSAALDSTHAYLLWNITRLDGSAETWFASGTFDAPTWAEPARLGIDTSLTSPLKTGFQSTTARAARAGESWLRWTTPLNGQYKLVAVAAQVEDSLALMYLRAGEIIGYEPVVEDVRLIGAPSIQADSDGHLYLAWAEANPRGDAALNLTTTKP